MYLGDQSLVQVRAQTRPKIGYLKPFQWAISIQQTYNKWRFIWEKKTENTIQFPITSLGNNFCKIRILNLNCTMAWSLITRQAVTRESLLSRLCIALIMWRSFYDLHKKAGLQFASFLSKTDQLQMIKCRFLEFFSS